MKIEHRLDTCMVCLEETNVKTVCCYKHICLFCSNQWMKKDDNKNTCPNCRKHVCKGFRTSDFDDARGECYCEESDVEE